MPLTGSTEPASVTSEMLGVTASFTRPRSILKTLDGPSLAYPSPQFLIYELNNMACPLVSERRSLPLASESFRATLKIILTLLRTDPDKVQSSREVREACQQAVSLADEIRHLIVAGQSIDKRQQKSSSRPMVMTHSNDTTQSGVATSFDDIETPITINLLGLNSYSLEQQSVVVLCNMALAARLCPTINNSISLQLFHYAHQSSSAIGDWHKKLQMQRRILQSMIDIYSSEG